VIKIEDLCSSFPIDRLPPELLAEVFFWYILDVYHEPDFSSPSSPTPYCWLAIRHVCRSWRHVALSFPKLSTYICLTRPDCVQDLLDRSGGLPLLVHKRESSWFQPENVLAATRLIIQQLDRVSYANMALSSELFESDPSSQSGLQEVRRSRLRCAKLYFLWGWQPDRPLFNNFFFDELEDLSCIWGSIVSIRTMATPSLRRLTLVDCPHVPVEEFLKFLEPLKQLEELIIQESLQPPLDHEVGTLLTRDRSTTLPRLRRLFIINSSGEPGIYLLGCIVSPPVATSFHCSSTVPFRPSLHDTFSSALLPRSLKHPDSGDKSLSLSMSTCFTEDDIILTFWTERQSISDLINPISSEESQIFQLSLHKCNADFIAYLLTQLSCLGH
jgi:hypothetical protein